MGTTIQNVEDYYRSMGANGESTSAMSIFNKKDDRVGRYFSKDGPIRFSREMKNVQDATVTLNRAPGVYGSGPMDNELLNFADSKWRQLRIVAPDGRGGSRTYIITAGAGFDADQRQAFINLIQGRKNIVQRNMENSFNKAFTSAKGRGLSDAAAATEARHISNSGGWVKELRENNTVGMKTNRKDANGDSIRKKFDIRIETVRNSEGTPANRPNSGANPRQLRGSGRNPVRDTTPQPKSSRKKSTTTKRK